MSDENKRKSCTTTTKQASKRGGVEHESTKSSRRTQSCTQSCTQNLYNSLLTMKKYGGTSTTRRLTSHIHLQAELLRSIQQNTVVSLHVLYLDVCGVLVHVGTCTVQVALVRGRCYCMYCST